MPIRIVLTMLIAAAFGAVVMLMDPFSLGLTAICSFIYFILPASLVAGLYLFFASSTGRPRRPPLVVLKSLLVLACFVILTIPANYFVQEHAVSVAKMYPAQVASLLEDYRQANGAYPHSLNQLPSKPSLPRLMRDFGYYSDGQSYSFTFPQPGGLIDVWSYDSETGSWHLDT